MGDDGVIWAIAGASLGGVVALLLLQKPALALPQPTPIPVPIPVAPQQPTSPIPVSIPVSIPVPAPVVPTTTTTVPPISGGLTEVGTWKSREGAELKIKVRTVVYDRDGKLVVDLNDPNYGQLGGSIEITSGKIVIERVQFEVTPPVVDEVIHGKVRSWQFGGDFDVFTIAVGMSGLGGSVHDETITATNTLGVRLGKGGLTPAAEIILREYQQVVDGLYQVAIRPGGNMSVQFSDGSISYYRFDTTNITPMWALFYVERQGVRIFLIT